MQSLPPSNAEAFALPEVLDLRAAGPLAQALRARRGQDLDVDASEVRRLGGLALQVLLAARNAWAEDGRMLALSNPSPAFVEGLERLGVERAA